MFYIYCLDEELAEDMIAKNYRLIKKDKLSNQDVWVFEYKSQFQLDADKNKYLLSKSMRF